MRNWKLNAISFKLNYIDKNIYALLVNDIEGISKMLSSLFSKL